MSEIQKAREALSWFESDAHHLGMSSEKRHEYAKAIRAGFAASEQRIAELEAQLYNAQLQTNQARGAWLLRKQAEAVEHFTSGAAGVCVDEDMRGFVWIESLEDYAQNLRRQADELEGKE